MIKRWLPYVGLIFGAVLLQGSLAPYLVFYGGTANLPAILVICLALHHGSERGLYFGLATGLLADVLVGGNIGLNALPLCIIGFVAGQLGMHLSKDAFVVPFLLGCFAVMFYEVSLFASYRLAYGVYMVGAFKDGFLSRMLLNGALMPLALRLISRIIPRKELELR